MNHIHFYKVPTWGLCLYITIVCVSVSPPISNINPIPKVWASMRGQSLFWKLCRGKILRQGNSVYTGSPKFKTTTLSQFWSAVPMKQLYSHMGFERSSGCTQLFPLPYFQKWDCRFRWAYSFGIGEVWWMSPPLVRDVVVTRPRSRDGEIVWELWVWGWGTEQNRI